VPVAGAIRLLWGQFLGQVEKFYGYPEISLSSSQGLLFKGCHDQKTAQLISHLLGDQRLDVQNPRYQVQVRHAQQKSG